MEYKQTNRETNKLTYRQTNKQTKCLFALSIEQIEGKTCLVKASFEIVEISDFGCIISQIH